MFCSSDPESLAAQTRPPTLIMGTIGGGGGVVHVPVSIPASCHIYANGNTDPNGEASPQEENSLNPQNPTLNSLNPRETVVHYRECQRNHAASMGAHAVDGCGEFMADEEEFLKCAACGCHRNFHRRETRGEESPQPCEFCALRRKRRFSAAASSAPGSPLGPYYTPPLHMLADSDDPDNNNNNNNSFSRREGMRKRFRTKFSQEQKEKMYLFAEKVGWRMQRQDEVAVQQFCSEIGVEKGVLKVWMHNNKHTLGKKP